MASCEDCIHNDVCDYRGPERYATIQDMKNDCAYCMPTADMVEVVRCKDCKYWGGVTFGYVCHCWSGMGTKNCTRPTDYCS